jgi:signal transduction histidine kinase
VNDGTESTTSADGLDQEQYGLSSFGRLEALRARLLGLSLREHSSDRQITEVCLAELRTLVRSQILSIYLLDAAGDLKRVSCLSAQTDSVPDLAEFSNLRWRECLSIPPRESKYGCTSILDAQDLASDDPIRRPFEAILGSLALVIRIPLNGSSQTFGMLEAVTGAATSSAIPLERELQNLMFASVAVAGSITARRARNESLVVSDVVKMLVRPDLAPDSGAEEVRQAFEIALQAMLKRLEEYKAVVLRIAATEDAVSVFAKAKQADITWECWEDHELHPGEFLAGKVYSSGVMRFVPDIEEESELFGGIEWVRHCGLRSAACFPLNIPGSVPGTLTTLGTLTVYTKFRYDFSDLDFSILLTIADAFALLWGRNSAQEKKRLIETELAQLRANTEDIRVRGTREAAILPYVTLLHQAKNSWDGALKILRAKGSAAIPLVLPVAEDMRDRLDDLLSSRDVINSRAPEIVDVQNALAEIVRARQPIIRPLGIRISISSDGQIPLIRMPKGLFYEVFFNLISNAEKSIQMANRAKGQIDIRIYIESGKRSGELAISVADNGVGIPRDKLHEIFERNYTTFPSGSGQGLFLALDIVEDFRGTIFADSKLGVGSTFVVRLPLSWVAA